MSTLNLAVIGNCQIGALLDQRARIVWGCFPRLDADPKFCALLDDHDDDPEIGFYDAQLQDYHHSTQRYLPNTAIVETILHDTAGASIKITDFAPRFYHLDRMFRPLMFIRRIEPLTGAPKIRIRLRPMNSFGEHKPEITFGSHHIRYVAPDHTLRLTTNASLTHILEENVFVVDEPITLLLGADESVTESVDKIGEEFLSETQSYWRDRWVRGLSIPFEWQDEVIRAAITLKLCTFEDTGAVIAAMTTSIPEAANSGRNWDYRFCWLRDSYFVVHALNRLGVTETMQSFIRYIINVAEVGDTPQLQPVYGISGEQKLDEFEVSSLAGYRGMGPVRKGNQAYTQIQNDVYGAVVLAAAQAFFDARLTLPGDLAHFQQLEKLGEQAYRLFDQPDAGLWEYRGRQSIYTFSSVMCWAACDRLAKIADRLGETDRHHYWRQHADQIREIIRERAWDEGLNSYTETFGGDAMDASLLLMHHVGFCRADDPRFLGTVAAIEQVLRRGKHLFRYARADDFGEPENAFNICTFWYIEALAAIGRQEEARDLFENMLACRNPMGLLSEDLDPDTHELWGNFPQTYSMVGIISVAMRLSRRWEDAF